jgi:hypothetical protein
MTSFGMHRNQVPTPSSYVDTGGPSGPERPVPRGRGSSVDSGSYLGRNAPDGQRRCMTVDLVSARGHADIRNA